MGKKKEGKRIEAMIRGKKGSARETNARGEKRRGPECLWPRPIAGSWGKREEKTRRKKLPFSFCLRGKKKKGRGP